MNKNPSQVLVTPKKYMLKADRFEHKAGTTVYECINHDYGLASTDTSSTDSVHISVTLRQDGDYPFFTVPISDLAAF